MKCPECGFPIVRTDRGYRCPRCGWSSVSHAARVVGWIAVAAIILAAAVDFVAGLTWPKGGAS